MSICVADQPIEDDLIPQPGHVLNRIRRMPAQQVKHPCQVIIATPLILPRGRAGPHKLQGIGANFMPSVLNTAVYDEIFRAEAADAFAAAKLLVHKEGISVGISSGAALHGAIELARRPENAGKVIVALLPDSGDRYYSTPLFTE